MKLRSESRASAANEPPIPFLLPSTQTVTVSNASSPLLRLPQELKDRIYHFVYGGYHIHVLCRDDKHHHCFEPACKPRLAVCNEITSDKVGIHCFGGCLGKGKVLPVASLGTCRQLYHEAKNVLYSAGDFTLKYPTIVGTFLQRLGGIDHYKLAMRSVQLFVRVYTRNHERKWDNTFRGLAKSLTNLRCVRILVHEYVWSFNPYNRRQSPAQGRRPFLQGLLEFKTLPLKTFELVVSEYSYDGRPDPYIWTNAQRRDWAQQMTSVILGSE